MIKAMRALVRPVVTYVITAVFSFAAVHGVITGKLKLNAEAFLGIAGMVIGFWFATREKKEADK